MKQRPSIIEIDRNIAFIQENNEIIFKVDVWNTFLS